MRGRTIAVALAIATVLAGPGTARGAVSEDAQHVVVSTPGGARAVVDRSPFRLSVLDASGRTVLAEQPRSQDVLPVPPVTQSEFGTIGPPPPALYGPLSFLVGTASSMQTPGGQWEGTLQSVSQAGVEYAARDVVDVQRAGDGVRLTVSTTDPTGRQLAVRIAPVPGQEALRVSAAPTPADGVAAVGDSFASPASEAFRGFGGRHNALDQRGTEFYNWTQQENVSSGSAEGLTAVTMPESDRYLFPNGAHAAYYVQSSFISSAGYGFLLDRDELSHWRMASDRPDAWQAQVAGGGIDYVVAPASGERAVGTLTAITGRQPAPPAWAAGSLLDRLVKYPSDPADQYQAEVESDIANIDRYHLPLDGYRIEGWQFLPRSVLAKLIGELRVRGIHPLLYFRSFVGRDTIGTDDPAAFDEAVANGYVATHADGSPYVFVSNFNDQGAQIDFTNPAAVRWWQDRVRAALDLGADGFMEDFGEQVQADMHFHDGSTGATMHNRIAVLYHRATRQALDAYASAHPGRELFSFVRAGYSGAPGSAAYEQANFPGDETTDWSRSAGLASQTPDMLNRGIGGAYGFTTDIGGFFDVGPYQPTSKELFLRWAEWAALSPLFRLHGSVGAGTHTPWSYDAETVRIYNTLAELHLRARPLILRLWREADRTGIPVARPLWLAYPSDPAAGAQDQEWLLGPDVLVAPVVVQGAVGRDVHFPPGCWERPDTGERFAGPTDAHVAASLAQLPYFFHCGTRPFDDGAGPGGRRRANAKLPVVMRLVGRAGRRGLRVRLRATSRRPVTVSSLEAVRRGHRVAGLTRAVRVSRARRHTVVLRARRRPTRGRYVLRALDAGGRSVSRRVRLRR
jgi:sulfoquinovosidase